MSCQEWSLDWKMRHLPCEPTFETILQVILRQHLKTVAISVECPYEI